LDICKKKCIFARFFNRMKANHYIPHINKDILQFYPTAQFDGQVIIVDKPEQVSDAVSYLRQQSIIGVDTESRPSFKHGVHHPTALVQIATEERCYLFRLSHIGMPDELTDIFADPKIRKVGLAFKDDIIGLRRRHNFTPKNCIDLQKIVALYGIFDLGLQKIFGICFGKRISKAQQLTNWEAPNLTPEQARYASTDAWATLLIYKDLMATKPLPQEEVMALKIAEHEAQLQHMLAKRAERQEKDKSTEKSQNQ